MHIFLYPIFGRLLIDPNQQAHEYYVGMEFSGHKVHSEDSKLQNEFLSEHLDISSKFEMVSSVRKRAKIYFINKKIFNYKC